MSTQKFMQKLARWHIWLGWVIAIPFLLWTITGLVMASRPLEVVRGEHLRAPAYEQNFDLETLTIPNVGEPIARIDLDMQAHGPVWVVGTVAGGVYRYSASDGALIPPIIDYEARDIAERTYIGDGTLEGVTYFSAEDEPMELRRGVASWRAQYSDGTRVYIDDATGQVLAMRTGWWRVFDFMYGLHIMNLETRSGSHHPLLIGCAILSVIGSIFGTALLFRRRKAKKTKKA